MWLWKKRNGTLISFQWQPVSRRDVEERYDGSTIELDENSSDDNSNENDVADEGDEAVNSEEAEDL